MNPHPAHDVHRNAVGETVLLVGAPLVERKAREKRLVGLRNHFSARVFEYLAHKPASQTSGAIDMGRHRCKELAENFFSGHKLCFRASAPRAASAHESPGIKMPSQ